MTRRDPSIPGKPIFTDDFSSYKKMLIHQWSLPLTVLGFTLVPLFFILDYFTLPSALLPRFAAYRAIATLIALIQFVIVKKTRPGVTSYLHGYVFSIIVGGVIVLMTADLSGFDARYYAGLNLVIIAVTTLLPLGVVNSAVNGLMIIAFYVIWNIFIGKTYSPENMISNLFFLSATVIISVSINYVRSLLIRKEFFLRTQLQEAQDALWSEMELAKKIQTSLLPDKTEIGGYEISGIMLPAEDVGGDYYDIIETKDCGHWVAIGDVSGHGLESGLVMMMAQISLFSTVNSGHITSPSELLEKVNYVIRNNLKRLGSNRYMTLMVLNLKGDTIRSAGNHQDILVFRKNRKEIERIPTEGTWIGLADTIKGHQKDISVEIGQGDVLLLFTDGITESGGTTGTMFGQDRLEKLFLACAELPVAEIVKKISSEAISFHEHQYDDITVLAMRKK